MCERPRLVGPRRRNPQRSARLQIGAPPVEHGSEPLGVLLANAVLGAVGWSKPGDGPQHYLERLDVEPGVFGRGQFQQSARPIAITQRRDIIEVARPGAPLQGQHLVRGKIVRVRPANSSRECGHRHVPHTTRTRLPRNAAAHPSMVPHPTILGQPGSASSQACPGRPNPHPSGASHYIQEDAPDEIVTAITDWCPTAKPSQ